MKNKEMNPTRAIIMPFLSTRKTSLYLRKYKYHKRTASINKIPLLV